jgi:hypothetical protein
MTVTPILGLPEIATSQRDKETPHNDAIRGLEAASNDFYSVSMSAGDVVLDATEYKSNFLFKCSGHSVARLLTVPLTKRTFCVFNGGTGTLEVAGTSGTGPTLAAGEYATLYCDGTNVLSIGGGGGGPAPESIWEETVYVPGTPTGGAYYWGKVFPSEVTITIADLRGRCFNQGTNVGSYFQFEKTTGDPIVAEFLSATANATFDANGPTSVTLTAGQQMRLTYLFGDDDIANVTFTLKGTRA